jgi:F-type H+-transporting ATPase subunit b
MEIVSTIALISINETLIVQLVSFLIFLFLITRIMIRPLRRVMWEREHHMEKVQKEIAESKKIIDYCRRELEERKHAVRAEARTLSRKMEAEGNGEAEKIFEAARQEIAVLKASKAEEIARTVETAKKSLANESEVLAASIMEKMLDRRLNP